MTHRGPFQTLPFCDSVRGHLAQPVAVSRDTFHQTRLLRAPSNLALNVSRDVILEHTRTSAESWPIALESQGENEERTS